MTEHFFTVDLIINFIVIATFTFFACMPIVYKRYDCETYF